MKNVDNFSGNMFSVALYRFSRLVIDLPRLDDAAVVVAFQPRKLRTAKLLEKQVLLHLTNKHKAIGGKAEKKCLRAALWQRAKITQDQDENFCVFV